MHTHTLSKAPNLENKKKSGTTPFFQAKLQVNAPGDAYEREADQVADQVMRMQEDEEPMVQRKSLTPVSSVQRMCVDCEEKQKGKVQRQETASSSGGQTAPPVVSQALSSGGGRPMDRGTRQFMEQRFGQDFGQVRIHTGGQAAESAAAIQAKAYTSGKDIVFGAGEYQPESGEGKRLLAHELVHVGQQGRVERQNVIQPYRNKKSINFGIADDAILKEDSFNWPKDKETKPWIAQINISFTNKFKDPSGNDTWEGTMEVIYYKNPVAWADFSQTITGGSTALGLTDKGSFRVHRIEGMGYNSGTYSDASIPRDPKNKKYSLDPTVANMHFAVFYNKGEALHMGPLTQSSHGCVHIDPTNSIMKQINYHAVIGVTKVKVSYS